MIVDAGRQHAAGRAEADDGASESERGLFVYAVVDAGAPLPEDVHGLDMTPVTAVRHGPVAAVVGEIEIVRPPGRRADLVAYSLVMDALAAAGPVVPVRFGSVMPDERAVIEDLLLPHEAQLTRMLADLAGRKQFNLRARYLEDVVLAELVETDPEIRELRELTRDLPEQAAYGERVRLGELVARGLEEWSSYDGTMLLDAVLPLVAGCEVRAGSGMDHVLDAALLVDDEHVDELVERLEELAEAVHERIRLRLVGPVAPYDFVGEL